MTDKQIERYIQVLEKTMQHNKILRSANNYNSENDGFTKALDRTKQVFLSNLYKAQKDNQKKQEQDNNRKVSELEAKVKELESIIKSQKIEARITVSDKEIERAKKDIRKNLDDLF